MLGWYLGPGFFIQLEGHFTSLGCQMRVIAWRAQIEECPLIKPKEAQPRLPGWQAGARRNDPLPQGEGGAELDTRVSSKVTGTHSNQQLCVAHINATRSLLMAD